MMSHMNENEKLQAKQLAKIRLEARKGRITSIRKRIAVFGVTLMVAFSGLVMAINAMPLVLGSGNGPQTTEVTKTDGIEQQIGATVVAFASDVLQGDDDEKKKASGFFSTSSSTPVQSSQS